MLFPFVMWLLTLLLFIAFWKKNPPSENDRGTAIFALVCIPMVVGFVGCLVGDLIARALSQHLVKIEEFTLQPLERQLIFRDIFVVKSDGFGESQSNYVFKRAVSFGEHRKYEYAPCPYVEITEKDGLENGAVEVYR